MIEEKSCYLNNDLIEICGGMNWWIVDEAVYWLKDEWIDEYLRKVLIGWRMNELMNSWWSCILVEG